MKNLHIIVLLHFATLCAFADSWARPTPQTVSSPNGESLLRSIPPQRQDEKSDKWSKMVFIVYRLDPASQDYRETSRFNVEGHPIELFINDAGDRIVTIDQYFGIGQGPRVVTVNDTKGHELKKWALKDFYDKKKIDKLPTSTASVHWRGAAGWMRDQKGIWISKPTSFTDKNDQFDDFILDVRHLKITKSVDPK
jgi:hypothetical protein